MPYVSRACGYPALRSARATRYTDMTFARAGFSLASGNHTFTAIAQDALGRQDSNAVTVNVTADGLQITNAYDRINRLLTRAWPDGGVETFAYSVTGLTNYTGPLANSTHYYLNAAGRLTNLVRLDVSGTLETNRFEHNPAEDLLKLFDGKNQLTEWEYTVYGQVFRKFDHLGNTNFSYSYDNDGRLTARTDALERTTQFRYDAVGNLTNVVYPGWTNAYRFSSTQAVFGGGRSSNWASNRLVKRAPWRPVFCLFFLRKCRQTRPVFTLFDTSARYLTPPFTCFPRGQVLAWISLVRNPG